MNSSTPHFEQVFPKTKGPTGNDRERFVTVLVRSGSPKGTGSVTPGAPTAAVTPTIDPPVKLAPPSADERSELREVSYRYPSY